MKNTETLIRELDNIIYEYKIKAEVALDDDFKSLLEREAKYKERISTIGNCTGGVWEFEKYPKHKECLCTIECLQEMKVIIYKLEAKESEYDY